MVASAMPMFGPEASVTQQTVKRRSPEFEHEAVRTMRLLRVFIYVVFGVFAVMGALLLLGVVASFAVGGGRVVAAPGSDQHAALKAGSTLHASTEAGLVGDVRILSVERSATAITLTARVKGMDAAAALPNAWQVYLWGDTRAPMRAQQLSSGKDGVVVRATVAIPPGSAAEFVQFNPDSSHGDLYFDVPR